MRYTPVELRHIRLARSLRGYKRADTDRLIEDVADSFAEVWRERAELADKLEDLETVLAEVKQRESLLATTLVSAQKAAADAKDAAQREAELIVAEAHQEARSITRAAHAERERLFAEARRLETLLRAALGIIEERGSGVSAAEPPPEHWPKRQDTREFEAVTPDEAPNPPSVQPLPPAEEDDPPAAGRDFAWG
jgi:cell division septum initiation protein DivIVA